MIRLAPTRRAGSRILIAGGAIAVALALGGPAAPSSAGASTESGWWMAPVALAPDVPDDGLVVQGGPAGAIAYAAARFELAVDAAPESLLLRVAPDSASTPNTTLVLCPLTERFEPVQGGPMAEAPAYDCAESVEAAASDDGTTFTFEIGSLAARDALAVAILPTAATDRVVLAAVGDHSLSSAPSSLVPPTTPGLPPLESPPAGSLELPSPDVPVGSQPAFPPVSTPTADVAPAPQAAPPFAPGPVAQTGASGGSWARTLLALGLVSVAAGLWSAAGAEQEDEVSALAAPA